MKYNPAIHNRQSLRLKGYDYSRAGLYFITICIQNRELLLGKIENDEMILNDAGKMVQAEWKKLAGRFPNIELHEFVVMPNHFHGILEIVGATLVVALNEANQMDEIIINATENTDNQIIIPQETNLPDDTDSDIRADQSLPRAMAITGARATTRVAPTSKTVGDIIAAFKSVTTVEYIREINNADWYPFDGKLWQRNYHDHVIRDHKSYNNISAYIMSNPARWKEDKFYQA